MRKINAKYILAAVLLGGIVVTLHRISPSSEWKLIDENNLVIKLHNEVVNYPLDLEMADLSNIGLAQTTLSTLNGEIHQRIYQGKTNRRKVEITWLNPDLKILSNGVFQSHQSSETAQALAIGISYVVDGSNRLVDITGADNRSAVAAFGLSVEVAALLSIPKAEVAGEWVEQGVDLLGPYEVSFLLDQQQSELRKSNKTYASDAGSAKPDVIDPMYSQVQKVDVELDVVFHGFDMSSGWYHSAEGKQTTLVEVSGQKLAHSQTRIEARRVEPGSLQKRSPAQVVAVKEPRHYLDLDSLIASHMDLDSAAASWSLNDIVENLEQFEQHTDIREETQFVLQLRDFLRRDPSQAVSVLALLDSFGPESNEYFAVIRGLVAADHPTIQQSMIYFIDEKIRENGPHVQLVAHLADFSRPSTELVEKLNAYAELESPHLSTTALLALGTVAAQIDRHEPSRAKNIVSDLAERLRHSSDLSEQSTIWGALGNAATRDVWELVYQRYEASPMAIRHRQVNALRLVEGNDVSNFILREVSSSSSESVRLIGIESLRYRQTQSAFIEVVGKALLDEGSEKVQSVMLKYLWENRVQYPSATSWVEQFLVQNPDSEVTAAFKQQTQLAFH